MIENSHIVNVNAVMGIVPKIEFDTPFISNFDFQLSSLVTGRITMAE